MRVVQRRDDDGIHPRGLSAARRSVLCFLQQAHECPLVHQQDGLKHPYYICICTDCERYRKSVRREDIEGAFSEMLKRMVPAPKLVELAKTMFGQAWDQRTAQMAQVTESYATF
jgi:hypothetical protein